MRQAKKWFLIIVLCLANFCSLSQVNALQTDGEIISAPKKDSSSYSINVFGRIGKTTSNDGRENHQNDTLKTNTIVADRSQFIQNNFPKTGNRNDLQIVILGYLLAVVSLIVQIKKRKKF